MAAVAILNFKNCNFWSRDRNRVQYLMLCTKLHWNWKIFHWDNGDITIFKMVAIRHLGFWKFAVFVIWPLSACRSAFSHKISPKSNNRSRSYGQKKTDFQNGGRVTAIGFNICCSVPNSIDIGQFFIEIWRFNDTKFCWNRTIGWWVMAKKAIFKMAAAVILNFENFNFWSCNCHGVQCLM